MKTVRKKMTVLCQARNNGPSSIVITIDRDIVGKMKIKHHDWLLVTFKKTTMEKILDRAMKSR